MAVRTPADMPGAKWWIWSGDPLAEIFFKAFHVSPIPLALPDVLTSLQMGVINGAYSSPLACVALQWFTRVKYMSNVPIAYGLGAMLVSEEILRGADPADVEKLKEICRKHSKLLIEKTRSQDVEAIEAIKKEGVTVLDVKDEVEREFFTTGRGAWKDGVGRLYPDDLLRRVTTMVDAYRANPKEAKRNP